MKAEGFYKLKHDSENEDEESKEDLNADIINETETKETDDQPSLTRE